MSKNYIYEADGGKGVGYPLFYKKGGRYHRWSDFFACEDGGKVAGSMVSGDFVKGPDGCNQNIFFGDGETMELDENKCFTWKQRD